MRSAGARANHPGAFDRRKDCRGPADYLASPLHLRPGSGGQGSGVAVRRAGCLLAAFGFAALVLSNSSSPAAQAPQPAAAATPGTESGLATFQTRCTMCHANSVSERKGVRGAERAPTTDVIRQ